MSNQYKKGSELAAWDLNPGCRHCVDTSKPSKRKLKKKILRAERKRLDKRVREAYNDDCKEG